MKKAISVCLVLMMLFAFSGSVFAAENASEVEMTEESSSTVTVYFPSDTNARGNLAYGTLSIANPSVGIASTTGATYANVWSSLLKLSITLYKYDVDSGSSTYIDTVTFYGVNGYGVAGEHRFTVPTRHAYYYAAGEHAYKSEEYQYSKTKAIKIN